MTDRDRTALLVIDVQNDVVGAAHDRERVVANIATAVDKAREADVPVLWIQHDDEWMTPGSDGWEIVPELTPLTSEPIITKQERSAFTNPELESTLADLDVGRLVIAGAQTDFCIRWTMHSALDRGYATVLIGDAHTTDAESPSGMPTGAELIAHTNSIWASQDAEGTSARVVDTAALDFSA